MSYKLLQISQLSAVTELRENYDNYTLFRDDLFLVTAGTEADSLSTCKASMQDVTHALYNSNSNTQAPLLCAGISPNQRVYAPAAFAAGIGQDFSATSPPAKFTVNGSISSNGLMTVGDGTTSIHLSGSIELPDNKKANFGDSDDLQIYHDSTSSYIDNNMGNLYIRNNVDDDDGGDIYIQAKSGEHSIVAEDDGAVTLYYDAGARLATKNDGVDITGEVQATSLDINGVGDISDTLTLSKSTGTGLSVTADATIGGTLGVTGEVTLSTHLNMGDNDIIKLGNSADLSLYHSGSHGYAVNITGDYIIQNEANDKDITLKTDDGSGGVTTYLSCRGSTTAVTLNFGGSTKLTTKTDGVDITGELQCDSLDVDGNGDISGNLNVGGEVDCTNLVENIIVYNTGRMDVLASDTSRLKTISLSGVAGVAKAYHTWMPNSNGALIAHNFYLSVTEYNEANSAGAGSYGSVYYFTLRTNTVGTAQYQHVVPSIGWVNAASAGTGNHSAYTSPGDNLKGPAFYAGSGTWGGGGAAPGHRYYIIRCFENLHDRENRDGDDVYYVRNSEPSYVGVTIYDNA